MKPISAGDFYNEFDPFAAEWLRRLIAAGEIPQGIVDERSIKNVAGADLAGFSQVHLFAGIAGWPLALRLAGWPAGRSVWTGSCPCQPYSSAGKGKGDSDERNLWPEMFRLIRECRPDTIFGEQVESAVGHGWLDGISRDLEREGYAIGSIVLGAHSVGAPHIRQRLFWVANASIKPSERDTRGFLASEARASCEGKFDGNMSNRLGDGRSTRNRLADSECSQPRARESGIERQSGSGRTGFADNSINGGMADTNLIELRGQPSTGEQPEHEQNDGVGLLQHAQGNGWQQRGTESIGGSTSCGRTINWLGSPSQSGPQRHAGNGDNGDQSRRFGAQPVGSTAAASCNGGMGKPALGGNGAPSIRDGAGSSETERRQRFGRGSSSFGAWSDYTIIPCRDGKYRRVPYSQSEVLGVADGFSASVGQPCADRFPLAPRSKGRVGRLKGYGNAIVPQVAAEFIAAFLESEMVPV